MQLTLDDAPIIDLEQLSRQANADSDYALAHPTPTNNNGLSTHPLFPIPLRPYQIDGSRFLRESQRAFCTYEPGLGKTETAISAVLNIDKPCYVVTTHNVLCNDDGDYVEVTITTGHWYPTPSSFDNAHFQPLNLHHTVAQSPRIMNTLSLANLIPPRAKVLIVAPSFMMDEWYERILQYLPDARVVLASGQRQQRQRVLNLNADWFIINYEMLHKRSRKLTAKQFEKLKHIPRDPYALPTADYYIFDESQNLKNHQGKQAQAAAELVDPNNRANITTLDQQHVYLLSGTPIKREPDDLYMQLHIMYPQYSTNRIYPDMYFNSYNDFVHNYCVYLPSPRGNVVVGAKGQSLQRKLGQATPIQQLMDKVAHYISYEDAEVYRPEIQVTTKHFTLDPQFQEAYDEIAQMYAYKDLRMYSAMEVMHALRAVTACPTKIAQAVSLAEQFSKQGSGVMFFTYYVGSAKLLASQLTNALGTNVPWIAGQPHTTMKQRDAILDSEPKYLVGTLKSLSVGTNKLKHMKAVCFFEHDWTPDVLEQATDRVRRFGNEATKVFVYHLLAKGTIDDQIFATVGRRGITSEMIVRRTLMKWKKDHSKTKA